MRVIIVDDHTLVRAGLSRLLQTFSGIDVVGEASNAQQALDMTSLHRPDLVLMDLSLPGRSGLDAMTDVLRAAPRTHVVMMSMHDDPVHVRDALDRGAVGFVVKDAAPLELELALRAAAAGQVFLSPQISSKMIAPMLGRENRSASPRCHRASARSCARSAAARATRKSPPTSASASRPWKPTVPA